MSILRSGLRWLSSVRREFSSSTETSSAQFIAKSLGIQSHRLPYQTHAMPVYTLPLYGASEEEIAALPDSLVDRVLESYGGLIRRHDKPGERRERLRKLTRDRLTIHGVVVSDKMQKSVVVAARRRSYAKKLKFEYMRTRRFKAHDEYDLCREGDVVTIRSCRPLSRWKSHVVVRNYGDRLRIGEDNRARRLEQIITDEPSPSS